MESVNTHSMVEIDFTTISLTSKDPMELFIHWRQEIMSFPDINKGNTMTLATVTPDGNPAAKAVLFCGMDNLGYKISADHLSPEGGKIEHNSMAALDFLWPFVGSDDVPVSREVRVEGRMEKVLTEESQTYFDSEPVAGEIQQVVHNPAQMIADNRSFDERNMNPNYKITKPPHWGGYRLRPSMMEFYERAGDNFADRVRFRKQTVAEETGNYEPGIFPGENGWVYSQLEP